MRLISQFSRASGARFSETDDSPETVVGRWILPAKLKALLGSSAMLSQVVPGKDLMAESKSPLFGIAPVRKFGNGRNSRRRCRGWSSTTATGDIILGNLMVRGEATVTSYPQRLLSVAKGLIDAGEYSIAVVVAHVACEIATDRAFTKALAAKGLGYLEEPVGAYFSGTVLTQDRNRDLFNALTGDEIQKKPFWEPFKRSVKRRNGIAHKGEIVGKPEAEESLAVATDFVAHLEK